MPRLNVVANLRYYNVEDETPKYLVINTIGNAASGYVNNLVHTTPLSYETWTGKLEGTYSLDGGYSLIAGIDYSNQDRTVPYGSDVAGGAATPAVGDPQPDGHDDQRYVPWVSELEEITYRLQLRKAMSDTVTGSLAYLYRDRDGSVTPPDPRGSRTTPGGDRWLAGWGSARSGSRSASSEGFGGRLPSKTSG